MQRYLIGLILSISAFAALPATTVWEVRPTNGLDTNGGCFDSAKSGTDFSQGVITQAYTDLVAPTTTTITSVARAFSSVDEGNCLHIASGTGWTVGWYEITSVTGVTATVDRAIAIAASTGGTGSYGGALQTLTQLNTNMAQSHIGWVKAEATISTAVRYQFTYTSNANTGATTFISGYTTTRGDNGQVTIKATAISFQVVNIAGPGGLTFSNFVIDCDSVAGGGINIQGSSGNVHVQNLWVKNCTGGVPVQFANNYHSCTRCTVTASGSGSNPLFNMGTINYCIDCYASGAGPGFYGDAYFCIRCIAANITGATIDCFSTGIGGSTGFITFLQNVVAYKCGRDGLRIANGSTIMVENSVFYSNPGTGIIAAVSIPIANNTINWNAFGSNTTANRNNVVAGPNDVTLTADPFTSGTTGDFSLNSTAGGGAVLKGAGFPGAFTGLGGTGAIDIGALQTAAGAAASTSSHAIVQ